MDRFVQLHLLTSYPPSNPNRDDLGRPKTALFGGAERLRISSQSLKRAWRTSEVFRNQLAGNIGCRTKRRGEEVAQRLIDAGVPEKKAREWARQIAGVFGKLKKSSDDGSAEALHIEQLAHLSPEEDSAIDELVERLIATKKKPGKEDLELLRRQRSAADIALFGRMLASRPEFNTEAACQVAHAITVHKVAVEDDFYTAVDDLNRGDEDAGAGHMGDTEFGAGLFYLYLCIDRNLLLENVGGNKDLAKRALAALVESAATVAPSGKQNSFGSRVRASYIMCEKGNAQPRNLAVAFLKPIEAYGSGLLCNAMEALADERRRIDEAYGDGDSNAVEMDTVAGSGNLQKVIEYATEGLADA